MEISKGESLYKTGPRPAGAPHDPAKLTETPEGIARVGLRQAYLAPTSPPSLIHRPGAPLALVLFSKTVFSEFDSPALGAALA